MDKHAEDKNQDFVLSGFSTSPTTENYFKYDRRRRLRYYLGVSPNLMNLISPAQFLIYLRDASESEEAYISVACKLNALDASPVIDSDDEEGEELMENESISDEEEEQSEKDRNFIDDSVQEGEVPNNGDDHVRDIIDDLVENLADLKEEVTIREDSFLELLRNTIRLVENKP